MADRSPPAPRTLFAINPSLDRAAAAARFAAEGRVQVRDVLTAEAAREMAAVLARTPWGLAANPGGQNRSLRAAELAAMPVGERHAIGAAISAALRQKEYGFAYQHYPLVQAYKEGWDVGGPHDLVIEHINAEPFMDLVRAVSGEPGLIKADAHATLFGPNQFLGVHIDSHVAEGWRLAYVLNFALDWHEDWGGYLIFYDADGDVVAGWKPRFNCLNLFAVPVRHAVSYVPPFAPAQRYAISGWFRDR